MGLRECSDHGCQQQASGHGAITRTNHVHEPGPTPVASRPSCRQDGNGTSDEPQHWKSSYPLAMPMCQQSGAAAGGRPISGAKLQAIEDSISNMMRELARPGPPALAGASRARPTGWPKRWRRRWKTSSPTALKGRANLQVLRTAETDSRVAEQMRLTGFPGRRG